MSGARKPQSRPDDVDLVRWALKGYPAPLALEAFGRLIEQLEALRSAVSQARDALDEALEAECGARSGEAGDAYGRAYDLIREAADSYPASEPKEGA